MVSKTVFFSMVIIAVIVMTANAKPSSYTERDQRKPPLRINRHGKRGFVNSQDNSEESAPETVNEYVMYDTRGIDFEDSPQRLRLNRHGK